MGFKEIMLTCLNFSKKSLQLEIDGMMALIDPSIEQGMSKQAFSKARLNILPSAFIELFDGSVRTALDSCLLRRFKGWRVFAIDGTELQLPGHGGNLPDFKHNGSRSLPHARASILCDVLSGFIVHGAMDTTASSERSMAMEHLGFFRPFKDAMDLFLFDRGYPSKEFIKYLSDNGFKYLMRIPKGFSQQADSSGERDFFVDVAGCKARVVKAAMPKGETGTFFTNLDEGEFAADEILSLYHLRWGAETKYNSLKNKLDIETFSGRTLATVLQDFYATLFLSNVVSAAKLDVEDRISARNAGKELRHEYASNENLVIGSFRNNLVKIFLEEDADTRGILLEKLIDIVSRHSVAIVPGRSFIRRPDSHKRIANKPRKAL